MNRQYVTMAEMMKRLGISYTTIYAWRRGLNVKEPLIMTSEPHGKTKRLIIDRQSFEKWLQNSKKYSQLWEQDKIIGTVKWKYD